ncbi:MAG: BrnA antitoxin family protein [Sulfuricellaceae bacterium]
MEITCNPAKNDRNIRERATEFDFETAKIWQDLRNPYPESGLPVIDDDGEVGDLSGIDPALFKPASEVLPPDLYADLLNMNRQAKLRGRPKAAVTKERITIRLSPDVVRAFRATGDGWQTRVDVALRDWLKTHSPA